MRPWTEPAVHALQRTDNINNGSVLSLSSPDRKTSGHVTLPPAGALAAAAAAAAARSRTHSHSPTFGGIGGIGA